MKLHSMHYKMMYQWNFQVIHVKSTEHFIEGMSFSDLKNCLIFLTFTINMVRNDRLSMDMCQILLVCIFQSFWKILGSKEFENILGGFGSMCLKNLLGVCRWASLEFLFVKNL